MGITTAGGRFAKVLKVLAWVILAIIVLVRVAEKDEWGELIIGIIVVFYINHIGNLESRIFKIEDESLPRRVARIEEALDGAVAKPQEGLARRIEKFDAAFENRLAAVERHHDRRISRIEDESLARRVSAIEADLEKLWKNEPV